LAIAVLAVSEALAIAVLRALKVLSLISVSGVRLISPTIFLRKSRSALANDPLPLPLIISIASLRDAKLPTAPASAPVILRIL
jgi:hypothetical protein